MFFTAGAVLGICFVLVWIAMLVWPVPALTSSTALTINRPLAFATPIPPRENPTVQPVCTPTTKPPEVTLASAPRYNPESSPTPTPTPGSLPVVNHNYTQEEWRHFWGMALDHKNSSIIKWSPENPPTIIVFGSATDPSKKPSDASIDTLKTAVQQLRELTQLDIQFTDNCNEANMYAYLDVSRSDLYMLFPTISRWLLGTAAGSFSLSQHDGVIFRGMFASIAGRPQRDVDFAIWHELSHSLGFLDHNKVEGSVLNYSTPPGEGSISYFTLDATAMHMLYDSRIRPKMNASAAYTAIDIVP